CARGGGGRGSWNNYFDHW
nr:immunoglobulin heavy chain junction region [Macaca mulatta]MOV53316.1 immunoglobulin heavy chain junction region [Macaca mulatta]MOV53499.1 immunoglobulin heavy chain junction region [Macaca mulatta]MOV53526.1 immunoglobulin heavy chain junction region [Macaca mulatta]MOV53597.1 immunoglobulin heavy chain junction region [Macaca mulatta]